MKFLGRNLTRRSTKRDKHAPEQPESNFEDAFQCSYHGWVMLPLPTPRSGQPQSIAYSTLVAMAKRVAVAQMAKSRAKKAERAIVHLSNTGIVVQSRIDSTKTPALLSAAIDTIVCVLVSRRSGVAVTVAHTWDGNGKRGLGCDVIRLSGVKAKTTTRFRDAVTTILSPATAAVGCAQSHGAVPQLQSVKHSPLHQRRRRRSTLAANCERDGGYISVETYLSDYGGDFDDIDDHPLHEHGGADEPEDLDSPSYLPRTSRASYLSICGPACADGYLAVESSYAVGRPSLDALLEGIPEASS